MSTDAYWAIQQREHSELFAKYERLLHKDKLGIVIEQQRFGANNDTCLSLSQMVEAGYQVSDGQDAFTFKGIVEENVLAEQLIEALKAIATDNQIEAAYNLIMGQARNKDHCALYTLRAKFANKDWEQIVDELLTILNDDCNTTVK